MISDSTTPSMSLLSRASCCPRLAVAVSLRLRGLERRLRCRHAMFTIRADIPIGLLSLCATYRSVACASLSVTAVDMPSEERADARFVELSVCPRERVTRLAPAPSAPELASGVSLFSRSAAQMRLSRAWALAAVLGAVHADLSPALLELVRSNLASSAAHSWEYGARAEAELEYSYPALSICALRGPRLR